MNRDLADKIARATLYEGYILYPYRPSIKSRQRWTFGGIYPKAWSDLQKNTDPHTFQTEVLVAGTADVSLQAVIRFLHLVDRTVGEFPHPLAALPANGVGDCHSVQSLQVGDTVYQPWQEATEREVDLGEFELNELLRKPRQIRFAFPQARAVEPLKSTDDKIIGVLLRQQQWSRSPPSNGRTICEELPSKFLIEPASMRPIPAIGTTP